MMKIGIDKTFSIIMRPIYQSVLLALALLLTACSSEIDELQPTTGQHTSVLLMEGGIERFDDSTPVNNVTTRAVVVPWNDGARLYVQFQTGKGLVSGTAVYNKKADSWSVTYNGTLTQGQTTKCEVYYFETPTATTSSAVTLSPQTAVYADASATYFYNDGVVTLQAHLKSLTGRVRFRGEAGSSFTISGLQCYNGYIVTSNSLTRQTAPLALTVGTDGYTPYVYALFADETTRQLSLTSNEGEFTKVFPSTILAKGRSGYLNIPTMSFKQGWTAKGSETETEKGIAFTVKGVKFTMIKVEGGTFMMGGDKYATPNHQVTLTNDYYIGETEVTQELWTAVMGSNPSYFKSLDQLPVENTSWDDCKTFITKLNALTGRTFRLPTEAEWEFAARGGNVSKGYIYSGSSIVDNVAWYWEDIPSQSEDQAGFGTQPVATKVPNELGIYDMSGNVLEWCEDLFGDYSSSAQINPTGPSSGAFRIYRGGCWTSDDFYCRVEFRSWSAPSTTNFKLGLRLAL